MVISGPSGVGKTALCDRLVARTPCRRVVTATTRAARPGERHGVDYYFYGEAEFRAEVARGGFLEHAEVHGKLYGTPRAPVEKQLAAGTTALLVIDVQGAASLMAAKVPATYVFIEPPTFEALEARLRGRAGDSPEAIALRLENARKEMAMRHRYDFRIVNADLDKAIEELISLLGLTRLAQA
ncbi:MAG: guanylate kinase [Planctomycetes bacterium]|nr:guanylate kinase [Planctomycetota bacterium]